MNVAVFYGGKSCEHDVSVVTGVGACAKITGHNILPIYIKRDGTWHVVFNYGDFSAYKNDKLKSKPVYLKPGDNALYYKNKRWKEIDVALLCTHGAYGEDGCLQGLLETSGIAYTGSGVLCSGLGLNKAFSKTIFSNLGLKVLPYVLISRNEYENSLTAVIEKAKDTGYPLIVKPNALGSSIGVSRVENARQLIVALNLAFEWDNEVLIERALTNFTELNVAVLGTTGDVVASLPEQPISYGQILSFFDKYERGGFKGEGERKFPACVSDKVRDSVRESAKIAFEGLGASGIARIDFLCEGEEIFINEINTIPGSLATYLFPDYEFLEQKGEGAVIEKLLALAIEEKKKKDALCYRYDSPVLRAK
ncbi:MAG: D-alanine--D-alanine ligase [Clostridia bacterium]|nr:D-alanine--D-alanine ligase [Clostridia bacterium]